MVEEVFLDKLLQSCSCNDQDEECKFDHEWGSGSDFSEKLRDVVFGVSKEVETVVLRRLVTEDLLIRESPYGCQAVQ